LTGPQSGETDPKVLAAVMAAVQAYLDEEASQPVDAEPLGGQAVPWKRAWQMAARLPMADVQFRQPRSWTGRS
jgi:hypothetical protein